MIKTIIIDDEYNSREFLEKLLHRYFPNKFLIIAKCESIDEAILEIENREPKLVFLDVQMPNKNGFELFKIIKNINFDVVFTTAHSEFALDAIKCSALDYLLKPINYIDLFETIKKFDNKLYKDFQHHQLMLLIENLDHGKDEFRKIAIPTDAGFEFVKISTIVYCKADSNYCQIICLGDKKITLSKTLKYIEELLPKSIFVRIHKSYLVNLNYVSRFNKTNELNLELVNGDKLPVSVRKKEEFINAINKKE